MLTDALFQRFRELIYRRTGINLSSEKKELLHARLGKRLRACGMTSFEQYFAFITKDQNGPEFTQFINAVSTNFTSFFREQGHFESLTKTILPTLQSRAGSGRQPLTIWSSACSSGEEPYTLAMVLAEYFGPQVGSAVRIIATDISTRVLDQATRGIYGEDRIDKIPRELVRKYLQKGVGRSAGFVRFKKEIRELIDFRQLNLMDRFPWQEELDIIFCRNVMIYFDRKTQQQLVRKFYQSLRPGGYLFIGHSESISSLKHSFTQLEATVFRR